MRKQKLSTELDNDKERLELMQREIRALQSPLPPDGAIRLQNEIQRLRSNCERMVLEVEEAGQYGKLRLFVFITFGMFFFFIFSFNNKQIFFVQYWVKQMKRSIKIFTQAKDFLPP